MSEGRNRSRTPPRGAYPRQALISVPAAISDIDDILELMDEMRGRIERLALTKPFPGGWRMALQAQDVRTARTGMSSAPLHHLRHMLEGERQNLQVRLRVMESQATRREFWLEAAAQRDPGFERPSWSQGMSEQEFEAQFFGEAPDVEAPPTQPETQSTENLDAPPGA